jgi:uncharacterized protein
MIIDIEKLPKEGLRVSRDFEFLSLDLVEENAVFLQPTHADLTVKKTGEEIGIKGRLTARLSFICSRCLAPFEYPIDSHFELFLLPDELDGVEEELKDEDVDKRFYYGQHIDLNEIVLEQLNLTFPTKPLCSENCQGICAVCGHLVREGKCVCAVQDSDPRLDRLKNFMKDKS